MLTRIIQVNRYVIQTPHLSGRREPAESDCFSLFKKSKPALAQGADAPRSGTMSRWNIENRARLLGFEESPGLFSVEAPVAGFDAQEEPIAAGLGETGHVEQWMIRHRQAVHSQHAEHGGERG